MAQLRNIFTNGRMDSDKHNSFQDDKGYKHAENIRASGKGEDGAVVKLKGSELVAEHSENEQMVCLGIHEGSDNKLYFFLAMPNGKSKLVQYDVETKVSQVIIQDTTVLRFDKIRWNAGVEIIPYKFQLSFDQIGDNLIFSNEVWENVRVVNLKRLADYASGFTEADITLNKKPPLLAPAIISKQKLTDVKDNEISNKFISFTYRYKYKDGDFSALSFYSEVAYEEDVAKGFKVNSERLNEGMVNRYNAVTLMVNSGDKNVTDIEVYAREHGSNTAYRISTINKAKSGLADNVNISNIVYKFSSNYPILPKDETMMLYSNSPKFPKTQTAAGNRVLFGNYKEGYDLGLVGNVDYTVRKKQENRNPSFSNPTAVSMLSYKVAVVYLDDYNVSTTALLPVNESKSEVDIKFEDRMKKNSLEVVMESAPPAWATKMKFVVKSDELTYNILYITYAKKIGSKAYLYLSGDNNNRVQKGDILIRTDLATSTYNEFQVEEVKVYDIDDGVSRKGLYALINLNTSTDFNLVSNGSNINKTYNNGDRGGLICFEQSSNINKYNYKANYQGSHHGLTYTSKNNHAKIYNSDYGAIKEGDVLKINLSFEYGKNKEDRPSRDNEPFGTVPMSFELYATADYANVYAFISDNLISNYIEVENTTANEVRFITNENFVDLVRNYAPGIIDHIPSFANNNDEYHYVKVRADYQLLKGIIPIHFRTKNAEKLNEYYYETPKTYLIQNGNYVPDYIEAGKPVFDIGFMNGYSWGNGVESYKIKDSFNGKKLFNNFRGTQVETIGYKRVHRKNDITYSGIYNYDLGINQLSVFNTTLVNWKTLPIHYGEIQRIISTDGDITVFQNNKVIKQLYGKSIIMDLTGSENIGMSKEVLGDYRVLPYEFGIGDRPESVAKYANLQFFVDPIRDRFLLLEGNSIQEINAYGGGFYYEGIKVLQDHHTFLGSYDEANNEYVVSLNLNKAIAFSLNNKGFSAYYTYKSDYLFGAYGRFYAAYKGRVYENEVTEDYNNLVGQGVKESVFTFVIGAELDSDKVFKAMQIISNEPWDIKVKTNYTESEMPSSALQKKESYYFTDIFRSNSDGYQTASGIGEIKNIAGNVVTVTQIPNDVSIGDFISSDNNLQYEITNITGNTITLQNVTGLNLNDYIFALKKYSGSYSPDGEAIRGKWMEVTLTNNSSEKVYLTGVNTEVVKSFL